jgi:uncharacterized cupredoxin-like copper-binding protein
MFSHPRKCVLKNVHFWKLIEVVHVSSTLNVGFEKKLGDATSNFSKQHVKNCATFNFHQANIKRGFHKL